MVSNPRKITDEMVMKLYKINTLPSKIIYQCLVTILYKKRKEMSKYIIKNYINKENIRDAIAEFEDYVIKGDFAYSKLSNDEKEIYDILKCIEKK